MSLNHLIDGGSGTQLNVNCGTLYVGGEAIAAQIPTTGVGIANKAYVDAKSAECLDLKVNRAGDEMTGDLNMNANRVKSTAVPIANEDLANKAYVDTADALKLDKTGGTITGNLNVTGTYSQNGVLGRLPLEKGVGDNLLCDGGSLITTGSSNTGFGNGVLETITSETHCSAFGEGAMGGSKSTYSCGMGVAALYGSGAGSGTGNNAFGVFSLRLQNNGSGNLALGLESLTALEDGNNNIGIGNQAGQLIVNESDTISIGINANCLYSNSIALGHNAACTKTQQLMLHNINELVANNTNQLDVGSLTNKIKDLHIAGQINGLTPQGGVWSSTTTAATMTGTTETPIVPPTGVGSLTVPTNGFKVGDAYHLVMSGTIGAALNETITLRVYGGPSSNILIGQIVHQFGGAVSPATSYFEIEVDFTTPTIGAPAAAAVRSNFDFTYNRPGPTGGFEGGRIVYTNNTTFNTQDTNILNVTAQWGSGSGSNSITTQMMYLTKRY